ncbi:MAG: terpene cyclase/mutase family protein [Planctomycetes bacterium]|nr:terpene cyclase/mutase family protein [Planctomycetota bacterium]
MWTRRQFLSRGGLGVLGAAGAAFAFPGDGMDRPGALPDGSASHGMITPRTDTAIDKGLAYLASTSRGGPFGIRGNYRGNVAVNSLAALAFMAAGNQPDRGKYGRLVTDTLKFILSLSQANGFLTNPLATPHGPMYGHGFGTLFLGEVHGMVHEKSLRKEVADKLRLALDLIVNCQNREGGWRYTPHSTDADLSVTVCQIVALRSARNAGFAVSKDCVDHCISYVKRCQDPLGRGFFNYMPRGGGPEDAFARTGAGLSALYSAGVYSGPEIEKGLSYLLTKKPTGGVFFRPDMQYFYGHYYAAQAMWTAGDHWWAEWFPAIRDELLNRQHEDGSWDDAIDIHYATAMACIILQIPNNYLPIIQK